MNRAKGRQVLDCASPLALSICPAFTNSARGLAHSKTLTRHFVQFMVAAACCLTAFPAVGQVAEPTPRRILQELREFRTFGTVLLVAAHPDDEDRPLLAFLSKSRDFRTGYLSINRGDGGQNEIGPEFDAKLGVIRTQELLAGRRIDGARQFFTRAIDFGYSKSMDETLRIWDHQAVLGDVVRVIRTFRPDVIVTRFAPVAQPGNHGHHNASAFLAVEAFKLAGDPKAYPEQIAEGLDAVAADAHRPGRRQRPLHLRRQHRSGHRRNRAGHRRSHERAAQDPGTRRRFSAGAAVAVATAISEPASPCSTAHPAPT